jgi:hypothetical protein
MGNYHVVKSTKSVGIGILLTLLLGPIGLFYSTVWGGIIMTFGPIVLFITFFLGMFIESELIQFNQWGGVHSRLDILVVDLYNLVSHGSYAV